MNPEASSSNDANTADVNNWARQRNHNDITTAERHNDVIVESHNDVTTVESHGDSVAEGHDDITIAERHNDITEESHDYDYDNGNTSESHDFIERSNAFDNKKADGAIEGSLWRKSNGAMLNPEADDEAKKIHESRKSSVCANDSLDKKLPNCYKVMPSKIHGMGLFATREIPAYQFLLTYEGEVIGKCVSDKREREYKRNGINSVYMFKIDEDIIIDATFVGNEARYMNHSCRPNCYSILNFKEKKVMYYTERVISPGEELTLNYYFSETDAEDKCNCGMANCVSQESKALARENDNEGHDAINIM